MGNHAPSHTHLLTIARPPDNYVLSVHTLILVSSSPKSGGLWSGWGFRFHWDETSIGIIPHPSVGGVAWARLRIMCVGEGENPRHHSWLFFLTVVDSTHSKCDIRDRLLDVLHTSMWSFICSLPVSASALFSPVATWDDAVWDLDRMLGLHGAVPTTSMLDAALMSLSTKMEEHVG